MRASDNDTSPFSLPMVPIMRHLLEFSVQQGQFSQELAQGLHMATQELLALQQTAVVLLSPSLTQPGMPSTY